MILRYTLLAISLFTFFNIAPVYAQNNDDVKSLSDILNPPKTFNPDGKPVTPALLANEYYKKCAAKQSDVFSEEQIETLCACSSAKMSQNLTIRDFNNLEKPNRAGREARGKAIAYGYVPCMQYATDELVTRDCRKDKNLKPVLAGKRTVCKCTLDKFNEYLNLNGTSIIMNSLKYKPMTMNPLEHFFSDTHYKFLLRDSIKSCRFDQQYERYN